MAALKVYVLSDALGETAEAVARAAASQFNGGAVEVQRLSHVGDKRRLGAILQEVQEEHAALFYTLVDEGLRRWVREEADKRGIPAVDVLGPALEALSRLTDKPPWMRPGLIRQLDEAYFRRMEAIEFAVRFDDGREGQGLEEADALLLGVSRSSKTPIAMYLAHRGYKVANIPLVPEAPLPRALEKVPRHKIVGLTIRPDKLREIRQERLKVLGKGDLSYADMARILEEVRYANRVFQELGCPVIDVTYKAVEESAQEVLKWVKGRGDLS
ncbi:MAG: pyruvate, water dikinase regulatory protein [Bacillota bacterium]|nr:pyruvate, water dikinase regulatory protein [Bacillota bacterium]